MKYWDDKTYIFFVLWGIYKGHVRGEYIRSIEEDY